MGKLSLSLSLSHGNKWFTLGELMIVIAIIGVLAAALFPALGGYIDRAKQTSAKAEMKEIRQLVLDAQIMQWTSLRWITNNQCSSCACRIGYWFTGSLLDVSDSHQCYMSWKNAIDSMALSVWAPISSITRLYRDPWNAPYLLDENEDEVPLTCDTLMSSFGQSWFSSWWTYFLPLYYSNWQPCN